MFKTGRYDSEGHGLVMDLAVLGLSLDLMHNKVFSDLN